MEGFRTALGRIGFNAPTSAEIIANGFDDISSLATVTEDDITEPVKHIGRWKGATPPFVEGEQAPVPINLPFMLVKNLRAMRLWVIVQMRKGLSIRAASRTNEQIIKMVFRTTFLISRHDTKDSTPTLPAVLSYFTQ